MRHDVERCAVGPGRHAGPRAMVRVAVLVLLERAAELMFRFTARPTTRMILEMHSWRSAFPELAMIERELRASARRPAPADLAATPFGPLDLRSGSGSQRERANG